MWRVGDLADLLQAQNPEAALSDGNARTVAKQCLWQVSRVLNAFNACRLLPIFASGSDVAEATVHDAEAIQTWPLWTQLNYEYGGNKSDSWRTSACSALVADPDFDDCDEYPFRATQQGGGSAIPAPSLAAVYWQDNQLQGSMYGAFANVCLAYVQGAPFIALPLVQLDAVGEWQADGRPSFRLCNRG